MRRSPAAAKLLSEAKFPVILNGAGVVLSAGAHPGVDGRWPRRSMRRSAAATSTMMPSRARIRCSPGRLATTARRRRMELIAKADVVLALGTRLNPFSTLPGYGIDYWPKQAKIIQVDINPSRIGLTKTVDGRHRRRCGEGRAKAILRKLRRRRATRTAQARKDTIAQTKSAWAQELTSMDHEQDDPGTTWNERARKAKPDWMSPRKAWRAISGGTAARGDHLVRHRQQLRHRQRLSDLR